MNMQMEETAASSERRTGFGFIESRAASAYASRLPFANWARVSDMFSLNAAGEGRSLASSWKRLFTRRMNVRL